MTSEGLTASRAPPARGKAGPAPMPSPARAPRYFFGTSFSDAEFMQKRKPVGFGPSLKT